MSYKVGDWVRVKDDISDCPTRNRAGKMDIYCGKKFRVSRLSPTGSYVLDGTNDNKRCGEWWWHEEMLEPANTQKIIIYTDGKITTAKLIEGKKTIKQGVAKCSPSDTFDFETGAKLAFSRLYERKPVAARRFEKGKKYRFLKSLYEADGYYSIWSYDVDGELVVAITNKTGKAGRFTVHADWCEEIE